MQYMFLLEFDELRRRQFSAFRIEYVLCMVMTHGRVRINRVSLPILLAVS